MTNKVFNCSGKLLSQIFKVKIACTGFLRIGFDNAFWITHHVIAILIHQNVGVCYKIFTNT